MSLKEAGSAQPQIDKEMNSKDQQANRFCPAAFCGSPRPSEVYEPRTIVPIVFVYSKNKKSLQLFA